MTVNGFYTQLNKRKKEITEKQPAKMSVIHTNAWGHKKSCRMNK